MSEHEIKCGDVDGRKRACCFLEEYGCNVTLRYPRDVTGIADFAMVPCLDLDARHAALVAQLGEAGVERIIAEWLDRPIETEWLADAPIRIESAIRDAQGEGE